MACHFTVAAINEKPVKPFHTEGGVEVYTLYVILETVKVFISCSAPYTSRAFFPATYMWHEVKSGTKSWECYQGMTPVSVFKLGYDV